MTAAAAMDDEELPAALRAQVGAVGLPWRYELSPASVRAWARGAGYTDPACFDRDAARARGYPDLPAPPGYVGTAEYLPQLSDEVFSEPSFGEPHLAHGLPWLFDVGTETEYFGPLCAGQVLRGQTRIAALSPRRSGTGLRGLLVEREVCLTDEETGALRARQRRLTLYCEALPWR